MWGMFDLANARSLVSATFTDLNSPGEQLLAEALPCLDSLEYLTVTGHSGNGLSLVQNLLRRPSLRFLRLGFTEHSHMASLVWTLLPKLHSVGFLSLQRFKVRYSRLANFIERKVPSSLQCLELKEAQIVDKKGICEHLCCTAQEKMRSFWSKTGYGLKPDPQLIHLDLGFHGVLPLRMVSQFGRIRHRSWCRISFLIAFIRANRGSCLATCVLSLLRVCVEPDLQLLPGVLMA